MNNADMPAMPQSHNWQIDLDSHIRHPGKFGAPTMDGIGLTKREHFAGMAMQGLLSGEMGLSDANDTAGEWTRDVVEASVEFADYLLAELERTK